MATSGQPFGAWFKGFIPKVLKSYLNLGRECRDFKVGVMKLERIIFLTVRIVCLCVKVSTVVVLVEDCERPCDSAR